MKVLPRSLVAEYRSVRRRRSSLAWGYALDYSGCSPCLCHFALANHRRGNAPRTLARSQRYVFNLQCRLTQTMGRSARRPATSRNDGWISGKPPHGLPHQYLWAHRRVGILVNTPLETASTGSTGLRTKNSGTKAGHP